MNALTMPDSLKPFVGRMVDIDSHEMMPLQVWHKEFGPVTDLLAERFSHQAPNNPGGTNYPDYPGDLTPITPEAVWTQKGAYAPGSTDVKRRLAVMDCVGVSHQLMYPSAVSLMGAILISSGDEGGNLIGFGADRVAYGHALLKAGNDWMIRAARVSDRIRPVALLHGETVEEFITHARALIDDGVRAVMMMAGTPPAGVSPAHSDFDPLWALFSDHKVAFTLHLGSGGGFLKSEVWGDAPAFEGFKVNAEFDLSPWRLAIQHSAAENFLTVMVTGGVFERFPDLRFGVIEMGAHWLGPLAYRLDMWHDNNQNFGANGDQRLPQRPSAYIARNVRVTPFHFEEVDRYIDQYGLEDCYCYSSDYPHLEGGKQAMHKFAARLERFGPDVMEKFFVTNGQWLVAA